MNKELESYARSSLAESLVKLPEPMQMMFKRMYSHLDLDADILTVVARMPEDTLDHAMQQVSRSLKSLEKKDD